MSTIYGRKLFILYKPLFSQYFSLMNPEGLPLCGDVCSANL